VIKCARCGVGLDAISEVQDRRGTSYCAPCADAMVPSFARAYRGRHTARTHESQAPMPSSAGQAHPASLRDTLVGREIARTTRNSLQAHAAVVGVYTWGLIANRSLTLDELRDNWFFVLLVTAVAMFSAWRFWVALQRRIHPTRHPLARRLADYDGVMQQAHALDASIAEAGGGIHFLGATLTPEYLVHSSWFDTTVLPTRAILWVYKKLTKKLINFIPVGTDHHVMIWGANGEELELQGSETGIDRAVAQIAEAAPGVIVGYDARIKSLVRNAEGRRQLEQAVQARRESARQTTGNVA